MIEMRWVERVEMVERNIGKTVKVLQYRMIENMEEYGLHESIWSEWVDVPTEIED